MILTILGARPQFVKAAVVSRALKNAGLEENIVHTGQHYDDQMSGVFWRELGLPDTYINLEVGSGSHGKQTAQIIEKVEDLLIELKPKAVLIYGDTNSTLAGAIAASKFSQIKIVHVEAGLRSFNREMPEEINRVVSDHLSHVLFCSSEMGVNQLRKEGIFNHVYNVGDVMHDCVNRFSPIAETKSSLLNVPYYKKGEYNLMTVHRPSNTDVVENMRSILQAVEEMDENVVWPVHPRNKSSISKMKLPENLSLCDPLPYFDMLYLLKYCKVVITDSGGLQKEAYWMKKKCITIRTETEWVETLAGNANTLTGPNKEKILKAYKDKSEIEWDNKLYGEGNASEKIASILKEIL